MNSQRTIRIRAIFAAGIATFLSSAPLPGATFTWDGGSFTTNNWTDTLNWNPIGAPDPDGIPVADNLIFGGFIRLTPNVDVEHVVNTITFNNTASAFTIGGSDLTVLRGITNEDTQTQTFTNSVLIREDAAIAADSGGLTFTKSVAVAGGISLTVSGGFATNFAGFTGPGLVIKNGTGTMTLDTSAVQSVDLTVNAGLVATNSALTTTFGSSSQVTISGGTFNALGSLTLDGGSLLRNATGNFTIAAGKTLTVQNGGDVSFTGSYAHSTGATINVTGAGSTLTATTSLEFSGGSTINVTAGGVLGGDIPVDLGNLSDASVIVDGVGSAFNTGGLSVWSNGFDEVDVTYRNGATGTLGAIELALAPFGSSTQAEFTIESGADVTAGHLFVASETATFASEHAEVRVTGAGSTLTQTGASILDLGANGVGGNATLFVQSGGTFTSGTGATTVKLAGQINILGGTYNANGNLTLIGGQLTRDATGIFNLASGKTLTVQNGGDATFTGGLVASSGASYLLTGAGSTLTGSFMSFSNGASLMILGGASAMVTTTFGLATDSGAGTAIIDGIGSSLTGPAAVFLGGANLGNASLTFRNGATGTLGAVSFGSTSEANTHVWSVESDADVTTGSIAIGTFTLNTTNTVTISGNGSTITQTGASTLTIGRASGNTAVLNLIGVDPIGSGATFTSGTGAITVNGTGVINLHFGTFTANGDLTVDGGKVNVEGGVVVPADGRTLTIQNGADAAATGNFVFFTDATANVTGPGSTLTATESVTVFNGMTVNVTAGGALQAGDELEVGGGIPGTVVVDGVGSTVTAGRAQLERGNITFRNGATGNFGTGLVAQNSGATADFRVESGASVTIGPTNVSSGSGTPSGTITVTGSGSTLTQSSTFLLGNTGPGVLRVQNGGAFTKLSAAGGMQVLDFGLLQINGGSATIDNSLSVLGTVSVVNGSLTVNGLLNRPLATATVSAGAGGTIRFNGEVASEGDFIGDAGLIEFAGRYRLAGSVATANFSTSAAFLATNTLELGIGGLTAGTQHDELKFTGFGAPHLTFGGTLSIDLANGFNPQLGQQFDLFDFDPARVAGTFSSIELAPGDALAPGLFFSDIQLYTTGVLIVVPEPGALVSLLGSAAILFGRQRFRRR